MGLKWKRVGNFIKLFDLFPANQFLRYKGEADYTTVTGGLTSLLILTVFMAMFASMGLQTAQRQIIFASASTTYETDPPPATLTASPKGRFMFAIASLPLNLNDPTVTYFDIQLRHNIYGQASSSPTPPASLWRRAPWITSISMRPPKTPSPVSTGTCGSVLL